MISKRINVPVEEFTTPNPIVADEETHLNELLQKMKQHEIRHIPIVREKQVVGIVSDRDLHIASALNPSNEKTILAKNIMSTDPFTMPSSATLDEVAYEMSKQKIGSTIINDENGEFLGLFTSTDALNALIEIIRGTDIE